MTKTPEQRTNRLNMLLTQAERRAWDAAAKASGESLSAWVRRAARERMQRDAREAL